MSVRVIEAGMLTTIQDLGRTGYQKYGISECGAMDKVSHKLSNLLVGNDYQKPTLECTISGPRLEFTESAVFAVCGADIDAYLNGREISMNCSCYANPRDVLSFGNLNSGCRVYIAVAGGFCTEEIMGSASTDLKTGVGGYEGRKLKAGDIIPIGEHADLNRLIGRSLVSQVGCKVKKSKIGAESRVIRVVKGPQYEVFTAKGRKTFLETEFTVSSQSNRMGIRLSGDFIEQEGSGDIISEGIAEGSIQVPANGQPIVMMADRQTTGGYAKIATVISADLGALAQCPPGSKIRFELVSIEQAQELYLAQLCELKKVEEYNNTRDCRKGHNYRIIVNDKAYDVIVQEM